MVNYKNGKIYKIISEQTDRIYIGSTCVTLSQRLAQHKQDINRRKCKISSEEILKFNDAKIVLIELFPCNSKEELLAREQYYLDMFKTIKTNNYNAKGINKNRDKELREKYRQQDPDKYKEKSKKYYQNNKEKESLRKKQAYQQNKANIIEKQIKYRKENKEVITSKIECICGGHYQKCHKSSHMKTQKHIHFLESQNNEL